MSTAKTLKYSLDCLNYLPLDSNCGCLEKKADGCWRCMHANIRMAVAAKATNASIESIKCDLLISS